MPTEYVIQGRFSARYGWETVCAETDEQQARERLREYRENDPGHPYRALEREVSCS